MLAAVDYPFLNIFWSMIIFFAWVSWIWTAVAVFGDVFRRHDLSGWAKAGWTVFVIALPFLGVLIYLGTNGKGMAERSERQSQAARANFDEYVKDVAASGGPAAEIEKGKRLLDSGAITQAEYGAIKATALSATTP